MLPLKPLERIAKRVGAKRISQEALEELAVVLEEKLLSIAEQAQALAKHAGRRTVMAEDVRLARHRLKL